MADFLTDEWAALVATSGADLAKIDDLSAVIQFEVTGGPDGKAHAVATIEHGQVATFELGKQRGADCTVIADQSIFAGIFAGDLQPRVAYMRGDIKLTGAYSTVLFGFAPIYQSEEAKRFWLLVTTSTTFNP